MQFGQPPVSATVVDIPVKEGQLVKKDDVLMVLSSEVSTQMGQTRQVIAENLVGQRERLQQDLQTLARLHDVERLTLSFRRHATWPKSEDPAEVVPADPPDFRR